MHAQSISEELVHATLESVYVHVVDSKPSKSKVSWYRAKSNSAIGRVGYTIGAQSDLFGK